MKRPLFFCLSLGILLATCALTVSAQAQDSAAKPPAKRTILQQADVASSPAQETLFGTVEIAPGSGNPFHTHYGSEIGYVVQGHIRLEVMGQPPRELGPGDSFMVPRGAVHRSVLLGNETVKLISTWTVDKGKPLLVPAPTP
jgi:quercetin dioxygenase-like cupin family protein